MQGSVVKKKAYSMAVTTTLTLLVLEQVFSLFTNCYRRKWDGEVHHSPLG